MSIIYRVDLENTAGEVVAIIKDFISLSYSRKVDRRGNYTFTISGYDDRRLLFGYDYILRVWMKDPSEGIPWTNTFNGIHKTYADTLQEDGDRVYTSFGPDSMELIAAAEVLYPATSAGAAKTAVCSTAMIAYVTENTTAAATIANGRQDDNPKPISTAPDTVTGPTWDGSGPWNSLTDILQEIREYSKNQGDRCDFVVNYTGGYTWEFKAGVIGTDRTTAGLTVTSNGLNGSGNPPVIFGPAYGNVLSFSKSQSRYSEWNAITALGKGENTTRDAQTEIDTISASRSPIAKRERIVNAANIPEGDNIALATRSASYLEKYKAGIKISFKPKRGAQILFRDYNLYDLLTAEDFDGNRYDKQIVEIDIAVQKTVNALIERQRVRFSDI